MSFTFQTLPVSLQSISSHSFSFKFKIHSFIYLAVLGLCCCVGFFSSYSGRGLLYSCSVRVSHCISLVGQHRLQCTGSEVVAHGLCCSMVCRIFLHQGSDPCLLNWEADSLSLSQQGSPISSSPRAAHVSLSLLSLSLEFREVTKFTIFLFFLKMKVKPITEECSEDTYNQ